MKQYYANSPLYFYDFKLTCLIYIEKYNISLHYYLLSFRDLSS